MAKSMRDRARILYIEDNSDSRMLVRRVLEAEGFKVLEAQNGSEALQQLEHQSVDLTLMDINMPGVDGYTLVSKIRSDEALAGLPILAITANAMLGDRERSLLAGCDGYIEKPIDIDTLVQQLDAFLSRDLRGS